MKVLVYVEYPFFSEHLAGGLQSTVRTLAAAFLKRGVETTVLCPEGDPRRMMRAPGLEVWPVLKEPAPQDVYPPDFLHNAQKIQKAAEGKDVIWSLAAFPLRMPQPIILSLSALCYWNDLASLFGFNWDHLIVPSDYVARIVDAWLRERSRSKAHPSRSILPVPLDPIFYRHKDTSRLRRRLALNDKCRYLLFPHRPEPLKGHALALRVLQEVRRRDPRFHLLIPRQPLAKRADIPAEADFIRQVMGEAARLRLRSHVTFHDWLDFGDLPEYYSLGECCLFLTRLPETFGAALIQSIACGTFVVGSGAGALKETVPHGQGHVLVPDLDPKAIAQAVLAGCSSNAIQKGQELVRERYSLERVVDAHLECFSSARKISSAARASGDGCALRLHPWLRLLPNGDLVDDFGYNKVPLTPSERAAIQKAFEDGGRFHAGVSPDVINALAGKRLLTR